MDEAAKRVGSRGAMPWWEAQLPALEQRLRGQVGRRVPALRAQHDDLVNDTLAALAERIAREPGLHPASWYAAEAPAVDEERAYLERLAQAILRRRIADLFRRRARRWSEREDGDAVERAASDEPSPDRRATLAQMLRICVATLTDMRDEDRDLIAALAGGETEGPSGRALTDRERQRLRRARARLIEAIRTKMGAGVDELLAPDEDA